MSPIRQLALVVNATKPGAADLAEALAALARKEGVQPRQTRAYPLPQSFLKGADLCCVIGGDGTLLSVVEAAAREQTPVLGINMGKLGFMATFSPEEAQRKFPDLLHGHFRLSQRSLLRCVAQSGSTCLALNDVVIKSQTSNLARLAVDADGQRVNSYYADGIILATPTGSTAYNLSAGGPILHPTAPVFALTPICPHTLSNRSVVFGQGTVVQVRLEESRALVCVTLDGRCRYENNAEFPFTIEVHPELTLPLVHHPGYAHFGLVREKLLWNDGVSAPK